jgi:hypothetical protein
VKYIDAGIINNIIIYKKIWDIIKRVKHFFVSLINRKVIAKYCKCKLPCKIELELYIFRVLYENSERIWEDNRGKAIKDHM